MTHYTTIRVLVHLSSLCLGLTLNINRKDLLYYRDDEDLLTLFVVDPYMYILLVRIVFLIVLVSEFVDFLFKI